MIESTIQLNFGCGYEYKLGYINIDIDKNTEPDMLISADQTTLDFKASSVDYIFSKYCLEHIDRSSIQKLLTEFYRILKPGGILEIYVPHFTGIAIKHLDHKTMFGIGSFDGFNLKHKDRTMSNTQYPKFKLEKEELHILPTQPTEFLFPSLVKFTSILDYFINVGRNSKQFWEKFFPGGFEEIHFILIKPGEKK